MEEHLKRLMEETDPEFLEELAGLFVDSGRRQLAEITRARLAGDWRAAERAAHSLKGAAGNLGAAELAARCEQVETRARAGGVTEEELVALREAHGAAVVRLRRMLRGSAAGGGGPAPGEAA